MSRKQCRRRVIVPMPPRGLRPKLDATQLRDLSLCHHVNLDAIALGQAEPSMLWDYAGSVFMWSRVAQLLDVGVPETNLQLQVAERLIDRYHRTGRVLFDGPDLQLARAGVDVMDRLASIVDRATAIAAAEWSEAHLQRLVDQQPERIAA